MERLGHLMGAAAAWGGNTPSDATYLSVTPDDNDESAPEPFTLTQVPIPKDMLTDVTQIVVEDPHSHSSTQLVRVSFGPKPYAYGRASRQRGNVGRKVIRHHSRRRYLRFGHLLDIAPTPHPPPYPQMRRIRSWCPRTCRSPPGASGPSRVRQNLGNQILW